MKLHRVFGRSDLHQLKNRHVSILNDWRNKMAGGRVVVVKKGQNWRFEQISYRM